LKLAAAVCGFISAKFKKVFEAIGLSLDQAYNKFGFLLEAFEYGTPLTLAPMA